MKEQIKSLMTHMPHTINSSVNLEKAKEMMMEYKCHHIPVLDGGKLVGVISDRDISFASNLEKANTTSVKDVMMEDPVIVNPDDSLSDVLKVMLKKKINSVIVSANKNESWGIFTTTDLIKYIIDKN
jgi:acetoin utilization protein AcuB